MKRILLFIAIASFFNLNAQEVPPYTPAEERMSVMSQRKALTTQSLVASIPSENIGPSVFSGRVSDIDVNEERPHEFYVGYASGGLWKTLNNGMTFEPLFDDQDVMTIGDIAVDWDNDVIWIGTGEVNSSRSSYAGMGIYKSTDGGKSWDYKGLPESHHIGRIILHPENSEIAWVAVLGHLYSANSERGVYMTVDGGNNWRQTLYVDDNSGAVDMVMDPSNPDILYVAVWHRERRAWNFVESGKGSGIYKSEDGGKTWKLITPGDNGFPNGEGVGRIGLDVGVKDGKTRIVALLDNYDRRPKEDEDDDGELTKDDFKEMTKDDFVALEKEKVEQYLKDNRFPEKYSYDKVKGMIEEDKIEVKALAEYLESANSLLFDTPVIGAEVYISDDGGESWSKTHDDYLDGLYYSYGYYFGQVRLNPTDADKIYIMGVPIARSDDAGKTFKDINGHNVHVDHHALWINPKHGSHLINGNDGGINISYDDGETWIKCNVPPVGQFYTVSVDNAQPYNVYGGTQDNGVWVGSHRYSNSLVWQNRGKYPYQTIMGGDGMQVQIDKRDHNVVYTGFQFGNYFRLHVGKNKRKYITPKHELGDRPYRWNWQSPILLSSHNQDIFYMGANMLLRSMDKGDNFTEISGDLTKGGKKGDVPYGTLTTIAESPFKFGLIYTGSDDGLIQVTRDGGYSWKVISDSLPQDMWVSRVEASHHHENVVYTSLNGYRWDDFNAYIYRSEDYGATWEAIGKDLPKEPVNVIKEDMSNENILYVGTDHSLYVSIDKGASFMRVDGIPHVPVHDLALQAEAKDLLVGTHGRSIYKVDIGPLQNIDTIREKEIYVFDISNARYSGQYGRKQTSFREIKDPEKKISVFSKSGGKATLKVTAGDDLTLFEKEMEVNAGLSEIIYNLDIDNTKKDDYLAFLKENEKDEDMKLKEADNGKIYLRPGKYKITLNKGDTESSSTLTVK